MAVLLASQSGLAATATNTKAAKAPAPKLLVLGDSISAEYGLERGQGWVQLLSERLKQEYPGLQVVNASISGETTAGGRSRLPALLKAHQPKYVLIELGGNDALRGLPLNSTQANLTAMVDAAQAAGAQVALLGIQVPPNYGAKYSSDFAKMFVQVAQDKSLPLMPFMLEAISDPADLDKYFQNDRIHPNAQAQPILVETVWPTVQTLLGQ
ncbi:arylesterase [Lampropedia aestuarii]|uniref:Arylesterase n=1 Tax=Lampropedia aestuarii TaxID=2562762 RepID=A0A4S5BP92_9BURK|nr:arylesterase [Lampropedia aestuarii]THJ34280.1 arylesterase [Lampropedia aestuarii]